MVSLCMYCAVTRTLKGLYVKQQHIKKYLHNARSRARAENLPFDLTYEYLLSIATDECPIFKTPFTWGVSNLGKGKTRADTPQLDRIIPELGYVQGNVAFISGKANKMKDNGTMQEHYDIADWIWEQTHAKKKSITPVSTGSNQTGRINNQSSAVPATGPWQNSNDADDYLGATKGENAYRRAKEGSGDSVGYRGAEVGAPIYPEGFEDPWYAESTVGSVSEWFERVRRQSRKLDLAAGTAPSKVPKSGD